MLKFKNKARKLASLDFVMDDAKFFIPKFIPSEAITLIYGPSNHGKTYLNLAIAKHILDNFDDTVDELIYFDMDNGRRQLKRRNLELLLQKYPKWGYYIRSSMELSIDELLQTLNDDCFNMNYRKKVFIFDSTKNFVETGNDKRVKDFMTIMQNIRDNGGTIVLIHHTSKNGKVIDGSAEFERSVDNMFSLEKKHETDDIIQVALTFRKDRDGVDHCAFKIDKTNFTFDEMDSDIALMSEYESEFVNKAIAVLKNNPTGLNQTEFLSSLGYEKTDKTARDTVDKFVNKFWKKEKINERLFKFFIV